MVKQAQPVSQDFKYQRAVYLQEVLFTLLYDSLASKRCFYAILELINFGYYIYVIK